MNRLYSLEIMAETLATKSGTVPLRISRSWLKLRPRSPACCSSFAITSACSCRKTSLRNDCGCCARTPHGARCSGLKWRRLRVTMIDASPCTAAAATAKIEGHNDRRFAMHRGRCDVAILFIVCHSRNQRLVTADPGLAEVGVQLLFQDELSGCWATQVSIPTYGWSLE